MHDSTTSREWCRDFIEHRCILRCPPGKLLLTSQNGGLNSWQFYLPIATLDQQFSEFAAAMFWEMFQGAASFQVCACESGGIPLLSAIQAARPVDGFVIKKKAKTYGLGNWLEGVVHEDVPVLLVDDVMGTGHTLTAQAKRLCEFGLKLHNEAFCLAVCKNGAPRSIKVGDQNITVKSLFGPDDFTTSYGKYVAKYGKPPQFFGTII